MLSAESYQMKAFHEKDVQDLDGNAEVFGNENCSVVVIY